MMNLILMLALVMLCAVSLSFYQPVWFVRIVQQGLHDVLFCVETAIPQIALTFDDGPDEVITPQVLAILQEANVPATWFVMGARVQQYPEVYQQMIQAGHQVANHLWDETPTWKMSRSQFHRDLARTEALINQGRQPRLFRPTSGWFRPWVLKKAQQLNYRLVLGSAYTNDPLKPPPAYMRWALTRMASPGTIVVLHVGPGRNRTPAILPDLIRDIQAKGLTFVTLETLLARPGKESANLSL